ncbi:DNA polymerase III subunit delta' [Cellulosilyticum sp. WCF-2]|uniref:DNA polymerase III subunit delta' n=2 Tax=unclassified Cellulosilyticum TaxID=2643091 RepID=UPI000F8EA0D6|nr:DNA polymerase III subunit delta' [Cellulosilyticum sp. WCF-2]QEH67446.1 DNA polymerase III subunit delta' [Cellulosilyticum sp. WCF-2]
MRNISLLRLGMKEFQDIIGNEDAKEYFIKALTKNHLSHSYIFEGPYGVGKKTFARKLAKAILCEQRKNDKACNECQSCHMVEAGTHPDIITIEKDTKVTKVDNIRENIVREMEIKPYQAEHKIIIVNAADTINVQGQNAMLKTIEEPPSYGIVVLVCENLASMLPTIKSRCITVRFNPLSKEKMSSYLERKGISGEEKEVYTKLSEGSIGVINDILQDELYLQLRKQSVEYIERLNKANLLQLYDLVKEITDQKEDIEKILEFWLFWYRDIAVIKTTNSRDLYYLDYQKQLLDMSQKLTYNKVSQNIESIKHAILDIKQNIYSTFVIENLLLKLKERKK